MAQAKVKEGALVTAQPGSDAGAIMALISRASTDATFDVAKLDALLKVKMDWEKDEARKAFVVALNTFKADPPKLTKNKTVAYGQGDKATSYKHATLDQVSIVVGKALSAVGISHRWDVHQEGSAIKVACVLTHVQGHSERVELSATADTSGSKNSIQAIASTVTYLQRYTLLAATGMAVEGQDNDGAGADQMPEAEFLDFQNAVAAASDEDSLTKVWTSAVEACRKYPKDMDTYKAIKNGVSARGKALKAAAKGAK